MASENTYLVEYLLKKSLNKRMDLPAICLIGYLSKKYIEQTNYVSIGLLSKEFNKEWNKHPMKKKKDKERRKIRIFNKEIEFLDRKYEKKDNCDFYDYEYERIFINYSYGMYNYSSSDSSSDELIDSEPIYSSYDELSENYNDNLNTESYKCYRRGTPKKHLKLNRCYHHNTVSKEYYKIKKIKKGKNTRYWSTFSLSNIYL